MDSRVDCWLSVKCFRRWGSSQGQKPSHGSQRCVLTTRPHHQLDFLAKSGTLEFDFTKGRAKLVNSWTTCVDFKDGCCVTLLDQICLTGRSERVVNVKCNKSMSLVAADFEPLPMQGAVGVHATNCRIIPNMDGISQTTILNTTPTPVTLNANKQVGLLVHTDDFFSAVNSPNHLELKMAETDIVCGTNLSAHERHRMFSLLSNHENIFASNPKKPTLVNTMKHRIITDESQPLTASHVAFLTLGINRC